MQQSRHVAMALRQLLVAALGGTAHPDINPRKCVRRYGLHTEPLAYCIVIEYQLVSSFARFEATFRTVKKTYNK